MGVLLLNERNYTGSGSGNSNDRELTWDEYQALPDAEKYNDTNYYITDVNSDGTSNEFQPIIYSENEREIGVWTDGKPLYQKTYHFNITSSGETITVAQNLNYIDTLVSMKGIMGNVTMMPQGSRGSCSEQIWGSLSNDSLIVLVGSGGDVKTGASHITLQYTKTTDSTSPVEYASPNDYSTSEKIVGTWVDGKPIYQKTITGTATLPAMPSYSSIGTTSELISSDIGDIIDVLITGKGTGAAYQGYQSPASYVAYVNVGGNINVGQGIASGTTEIAYRITVQYTKSTD